MAERVFLHIGAAKTGTSYLQLLLWNNRGRLRQQGVHLPLRKRRHHFDAVADLRGGIWADRGLTRTWDQLAAGVHRIEGTAVVSEELLCATPAAQVERIMETLAPVEVHVVLTARDIGRQAPASWQQIVRARGVSTYDEYLRRMREDPTSAFWTVQDPVGVHRRWGPHVGPGRFHLVTVPQRGRPASLLWERFASVIGADPARVEAPSLNQNESLGLVETELLRRFNAQLGDAFPMRSPYIDNVRRWLTTPALMGADNERIGLPAAYADWVHERSRQMVDEVRALSGEIDVVGDPDDLLADVTVASRAPGDLSEGDLLERALKAWVRQLQFLQQQEELRVEAAEADRVSEAGAAGPGPGRTARVRSLLGRARRRG